MAEAVDVSPTGKFELLANRNFMLLWCAYGVSAVGDHLSEMAILKTQNAVSTDVDVTPLDARMTFLFFVPFFLIGPVAGYLADRLPRRGLMVLADLVRMAIMLSFAVLMAWTAPWSTWGPFLPLLAVGLFAALFSPARSSLLPTLIRPDQLVRANGMIAGLGIIGTMTALWLGGHLAGRYHPTIAFRTDAATYLASAMLLTLIRPPRQHPDGSSGFRGAARQIAEGFRYVVTHRRVVELLLVAALVWFCGPLVKCVIPAIVRDVYGCKYQAMSGFRAFLGGGFILGSVLVAVLGGALRAEIAMTWGLFGIAGSIAIFAVSVFAPWSADVLFAVGAVGITLTGTFGVAVMIGLNALLQRIVPDRFRGRVFGVKDLWTTFALLVATASLGIPRYTRVDRWVGHILIGVALMTLAAGIVTLIIRIRRSALPPIVTLCEHGNEFLAKSWWRLKRIGRMTVPRLGPVIVTANHTCSADPLLLSACMPYRALAFMVAAEYTTWPIFGWFMRVVECIPIKRELHDTGATRRALRHLRSGKALGVFIEGRIVSPGERSEPKDGVAMLALKSDAVVIPAHISGIVRHKSILRGLFARHRARVRFGPPVDLDEFRARKVDRVKLHAATLRIFAAIEALAPNDETMPATAAPVGVNDHESR